MELPITLGVLFLEVLIILGCIVIQRRPPNPLRPRLLPYAGIMGLAVVLGFATLAHLIGLVTGHPVMPRTGKYG